MFTTPFHTDEWKDVSGITVASDELDAALTESPTEHEDVTIIVDDIECARQHGHAEKALKLKLVLKHFVDTHPQAVKA